MDKQATIDQFRSLILAELARENPSLSFQPDSRDGSTVWVRHAQFAGQIAINLTGALGSYQKGEPLAELAAVFLRSIIGIVSQRGFEGLPWSEIEVRLTLQLRRHDNDFVQRADRISSGRSRPVIMPSPFPGLDLYAAVDTADAIALILDDALARWQATATQVLVLARRQTRLHLPKWHSGDVGGRRVWEARDNEGYAATAIAIEESLAEIPVSRQRLWVACPARDLGLAFEGGAPETDGLVRRISAFVREVYGTNPHALSPSLFKLAPGQEIKVVSVYDGETTPSDG